MPFSKSVPLSRLISLVTSLSLILPSLFPFTFTSRKASFQTSDKVRRTQGAPSRNLPNLDKARGVEPGPPKIMPPVPATKCRGRDEKCKRANGNIGENLPDNQHRAAADDGHRSRRDYVYWLNTRIPALSMLAYLVYWPASMISDFTNMPYRDGEGALTGFVVNGANPRNKTYGGAASKASRKEYGYRSGRSLVAAQGSGIITVNPSAYQTPYGGGTAINSPSNTGGSASINITGPGSANKTCKWSGFAAVSGQIVSIRLKMDWSASVSSGSGGFAIDYSLDGGINWTNAVGISGTGFSQSSSVDIALQNGQDLTQVQVKDSLSGGVGPGVNLNATASVSNIRLEVDTAPVISNVAAGGITSTGATITWTTNENSDSQVEYGTTTAYGQSTTLNSALVTAHSQALSGLTAGTLYHYRVKSRDATGNLAVSGDFTFTTAPPPDTTPPVISNVAAGGITSTGATITWTTNENSDSQVEYGTTTAYGQSTTLNSALVTAHSQALSGLTAGTLYHYRVKSRDAAGNLAVSGDFTFTTAPETTPPTVTSFSPAAGATNVITNANVTVTFSEAMNPATVNGSTVELRDPSNALVPATVSYNAASFIATLDPSASLSAGVTYTARVRGGSTDPRVKDLAGNAMSADVTWTFTAGWPATLSMALIDPINSIGSPGENLLSRNCNWSLPLLALPGRAGLDLGLALSLNSLVYTRAGSVMNFDPDQGYPALGFKLGFPEIRNAFTNTDAGVQSYLLSMPSGSRVELRQINTNVYEAVDSSHMLLTRDPVNSVFVLYTTDGTQCRFVDVTGLGDYKCVQIKDRQGNYMTIGYGSLAEIRTVTDTLGRVVNFNYDGFNHLLSITQNWGGQTHTWATFAYGTQTIQTNFPGLTLNGTANGAQESVLLRVGLADGSVYSFEYNTYCQVKTIRRYAPNNSNPVNFPGDYFQLAYTTYGLPDDASNPQTDCPRITSRTDWASDWNSGVTSVYAADSGYAWGQVTAPDGTIYKEFFATTGWQRGLTTQTESWSGGVRKKWTILQWTQDNTGVSYRLNPRVTETNVYDDAGNRRRMTTSYTSFGLPSDVYGYDADAATVLRHAHTDYNLSAVYTDRRIIGLPSAQYLYDGANTLFSKVTYVYDLNPDPNPYLQHQGPPVQHDTANYGAGFVQGRGNLNVIKRWDVTDQNNESKASEYEKGYNTSGSVIFTRDPLDHQSSVSFADSFSDGQNNRNTLAYPTTITDADNYSSTVQYNYDFGAVTRTQDPKGAAVVNTYDSIGRLDRVTNQVNSAYTRYVYAPNHLYVQSYTTVNDLSSEFYRITVFDGRGMARGVASAHPGSAGGYKAQNFEYDIMGRLIRQTNPTEINVSWQAVGDDAAGWVSSQQAYDWKGRPTVATNQRGNTSIVDYSGCACAGGEVVTTQDEGQVNDVGGVPTLQRRKTQVIHDALGREKKRVFYNWDGTVYASATTSYNALDQVTSFKQYKGDGDGVSCPTATCQEGTRSYDGHGRLAARRLPQDDGNTTYTYYANDLLQSSADARGATGTFSYNNRGLMTGASYAGGSAATQSVSFDYDELGNPRWMEDGPGRVDYNYDTLGRLMAETRRFDSLPGMTFPFSYDYNLAGEIKQVTDPRGDVIYYGYDSGGSLTGVTGSSFAGVTNYATGFQYRAWGQPKYLAYGDSFHADIGYDAQLSVTSFNIPGVLGANYTLNENGQIRIAQSLIDSRLNRSFDWDHMGRIKSSLGGGGADPIQFNQDYGYDEYGHLTSRGGWYWNTFSDQMTATYSRERAVSTTERDTGPAPPTFNRSFQYDAMGSTAQVTTTVEAWQGGTSTSTVTNSFDAVGRPSAPGTELDGYGRVVKTGQQYNLISTPFGGQVLTILDGGGQKTKGRVYVGTDIIAEQMMLSGQPSEVVWRHRDPMNTASRDTKSGGWTDQLYMVDPLGAMLPAATSTEIQATQNSLICARAPHPGCEGQPSPASFYTPNSGTYSSNGAAGQWASGCGSFSASVSCGSQLDFFNHMSKDMQQGYQGYAQILFNAGFDQTLVRESWSYLASSFAGVTAAGIGGTFVFKEKYAPKETWEKDPKGNWIRRVVGFDIGFVPGGEPGPQGGGQQSGGRQNQAPKTNCVTPNSLINDPEHKKLFEDLWGKTMKSTNENGAAIFYEKATKTYYPVILSEGEYTPVLSIDGQRVITEKPTMPRGEQEMKDAIKNLRVEMPDIIFMAWYHTHPNFKANGAPRSGEPSGAFGDLDVQSALGYPLGIIRTGDGYFFFMDVKTFRSDDPMANKCITDLIIEQRKQK